jgi:hypothetical protein
MSLVLPLIGMGVSAVGKGIQAFQNAKANKLAEENYNAQRGSLLTDLYSNPLDSLSTKSLLSDVDRKLDRENEKIANLAAAGGATFENTLAAKQAGNEVLSDTMSGLMQADQARKDGIKNQLLNLDSRRTAQQMAMKQQSGAAWSSLADSLSGSLSTLGGTMLENGIPLKDLFKFK